MSSPTLPANRKVIFITPEELSKIQTDAPIYVLSSEKEIAKHSTNSAPTNPISNASTSVMQVNMASSSESVFPPTVFPMVPQLPNALTTVPYAAMLPSVPSIMTGPQAIGGFAYPGTFPYMQYMPPFPIPNPHLLPPWAQLPPMTHTQLPMMAPVATATLPTVYNPPPMPSTTNLMPRFNLAQPPPSIVSIPSSTTLSLSSPSLTNGVAHRNSICSQPKTSALGSTSFRSKLSDSSRAISNKNESNSASRGTTTSKPKQLVRYRKLVCAPAPDHFTFNQENGCYEATDRQIALENRFADEVLSRRLRTTASQPERKPLNRDELCSTQCDNEAQVNDESLRKSAQNSRPVDIKSDLTDILNNTTTMSGDLSDASDNCFAFPLIKPGEKRLHTPDTHHRNSNEPGPMGSVEPVKSGKSSQRKKRKSHLTDGYATDEDDENRQSTRSTGCRKPSTASTQVTGLQRSLRQQREVAYKLSHPNRLHPDIWHNESHEFNDGPACSCKTKYRIGPLHNQYEGEELIPLCAPESNNRHRLYHYRVLIAPTTNFILPNATTIRYNDKEYQFEGYSLFLHYKLDMPPPCQILRFNLLYDLVPIEEDFPELFTVRALDMLTQYVFFELLELMDLSWRPQGVDEGCAVIHLMPRFIRPLTSETKTATTTSEPDVVGEILPVNAVLDYLLQEALTPVIDTMDLASIQRMNTTQWSNYISSLRGTLATFPGKKPAAIRIDQLDRRSLAGEPAKGVLIYPLIVHMTFTPMKLSLTREPKYKSVLKNFMKLQYLMVNKPRITPTDRAQLAQLASELENMEHSGVHRREITVELSCDGFYRTGLRPDVSQHAINLVSLVSHLRFHKSLESLEDRLGYRFKDRSLLHQALTHPSYRRTDFGTNQDHFQNSLVSCGPRILEYGDKMELYKAWRKKGLTKMIQVMSVLPKMHEERSNIYGNERLEFLGDAVIEVISSVHLFFMFPDLPEGNLDAYRQAIVQNQHLAKLAVRLGIHKFLLYTHSVDFSYDSTFIYARSDAFEALMAAIALDAGLEIVDRIFGAVLFGDEPRIHRIWVKIPLHPLQAQYPDGDRSWAVNVPMLKKLPRLEEDLGIEFKHLRVLARAMTIRKTGFNFYTLGDNQRLEFLGDSLLKYVSTDYLFRHFPRHHEGHLSLLKNSLVNKYTQAVVCSELGLDEFVIRREDNSSSSIGKSVFTASAASPTTQTMEAAVNSQNAKNQNVKYKADLLEAFIGALFVDKDLVWVERFCQVCFWPRLVEFILKQEWNDAKSKLQQCCLTFRSLHEDPEIAHYKVLDHSGPTNQRVYMVGVYFRGKRLATGSGRSVQQAQMEAAKSALEVHQDMFRQLDFQRSVISRRYKQPYIEKMLGHVQNWDERLVDYFVPEANTNDSSTEQKQCDDVTKLDFNPRAASVDKPSFLNRAHETDKPSSSCLNVSTLGKAEQAVSIDKMETLRVLISRECMATRRDCLVKNADVEEGEITDEDDDEEESEAIEIVDSDTMDLESDSDTSNTPPPPPPSETKSMQPTGTLADLLRFRKT